MEYWRYLDITPPPVEPVTDEDPKVILEEAAVEEDSVDISQIMDDINTPSEDLEKPAPSIDPFSTEEIPAAEVVLPATK